MAIEWNTLWRSTYHVLFLHVDRNHPNFGEIQSIYSRCVYVRRCFFGSLITTMAFSTLEPTSPIITDITKAAMAFLICATAQALTEIEETYEAFTTPE